MPDRTLPISPAKFRCESIRRFLPLLTAIVCVGLAFALRIVMGPLLEGQMALTVLLLAVVASAYLAGPWSAFFAALLAALVGIIYFIEPRYSIFPMARRDLIHVVVLLVVGVLIALISGRMSLLHRRARRDAEDRAHEIARMIGQLQVADRLALIGTLTAGLTHDIGNLLLPLHSRIESVDHELKEHNIHSENIELLRHVTEYLGSLSTGVSQLVAQPDRPKHQSTSLHEWAPSMQRLLKMALPRNVELAIKLPADLPAVQIAPQVLSQAVFNLVHNSGKAINGRRGHVVIEAQHDADHHIVRLLVRDDGPGMNEDTLRRMREFTPTAEGYGRVSGVGLKVVHSLIAAAGGSVQVSSHPGAGTEVTLALPLAAQLTTA